jgi:hypothetical protein
VDEVVFVVIYVFWLLGGGGVSAAVGGAADLEALWAGVGGFMELAQHIIIKLFIFYYFTIKQISVLLCWSNNYLAFFSLMQDRIS